MAIVTAVDLGNACRTLVSVDDGAESVAYLGLGASWARVADFTPTAFSAIGNTLVQKDVIAGNRVGGPSSRAFVAADDLAKEIRRRADVTFSTIANAVNGSGTASGSRANGNFWQAFSIEP